MGAVSEKWFLQIFIMFKIIGCECRTMNCLVININVYMKFSPSSSLTVPMRSDFPFTFTVTFEPLLSIANEEDCFS
tara:strand:+ start:177 stop:404 length:228 start_codon:yes stop_codon:yes gene_type:complete